MNQKKYLCILHKTSSINPVKKIEIMAEDREDCSFLLKSHQRYVPESNRFYWEIRDENYEKNKQEMLDNYENE